MFVWRKRTRFSVVILLGSTFTQWGNAIILISSKLERTFKRYKREWILKRSPWTVGWQSAIDTTWQPKTLSRQSTDRIGELFVKVDRELKGGITWTHLETALL
jgi:hypothetical protein